MRRSRFLKILWLVAGVTILCATAFRLWLPNFIKNQLAERFDRVDNYTITFDGIDISTFRGAYTIEKITVVENDSKAPVPFFTADAIRFTTPWASLIDGKFFSSMDIYHAELNFVRGPSAETSQLGVETEILRLLKKLSPYPIDKFNVAESKISFRDYHQTPKVELIMHNVEIAGSNLRNTNGDESLLPGLIVGGGNIANGSVSFRVRINALQDEPLLEMQTDLADINLAYFSDFFKADHDVNVNKGLLSMKAKSFTKDNKVVTEITNTIENLQVNRWTQDRDHKGQPESSENEAKFVVASWNMTTPQADTKILEGEIENYKGNLVTLTSETLLGIFSHSILSDIDKVVPRPVRKPEPKIKVAKADKKDKKNIFQKIFRKKIEEEEKRLEEGTVTASERK